jgi:hypothetical protein
MIVEFEQDEQSSAASEVVPKAPTMPMAPMSTKCCSHGDQVPIEPHS